MHTQTERRPQSTSPWKRAPFILPLVLVNAAALVGQSIWTYQQLSAHFLTSHRGLAVASAILMGLAVESIAIYLAVQAHSAMMADQASGGLRLGSYLVGGSMAVVNFTHFSSAPVSSVPLGAMFGVASLLSPWLWAVDSKAAHRAQLAARGIVDPRGVKLSTVRKISAPIRSLRVFMWAAWAGETDPARAVRGWESTRQSIPQSTQTVQARATIEVAQSVPAPAIEAAESANESVTETVTETVTRTRTQTHTRTQARIETLSQRAESVRVHPSFLAAAQSQTELSYDEIGAIIGRTGRGVIGPVFAVLYRGQSAESVILGLES